MTYAIAVDFDIESTDKMRKKIIEIAQSNINPYMVINKIRPHLTISLFEAANELEANEVFKDICTYVTSDPIKVCNIGMFEPKVIYYAPTRSEFLISLNKITTNKLFEVGINPDEYYLPEQWVPHIALGVQLTSIELIQALEIVKRNFEPFNAMIEKVVLAECNPYKEILEYFT